MRFNWPFLGFLIVGSIFVAVFWWTVIVYLSHFIGGTG